MIRRGAWEIFAAFLRLGCMSFGGPPAHIAYYREELVKKRQWIDERLFAEVYALCQMLPGPGSSQTGFAIGLLAGGWRGAIAAWLGFTGPSAIIMLSLGLSEGALGGPAALRVIHGLQLAAVAVVAQAVIGMRRTLAPDWLRGAIAVAAFAIGVWWHQLAAIALGAVVGLALVRPGHTEHAGTPLAPYSKRVGVAALIVTGLLFAVPGAVFQAFYRTGALVFGGGHVVLPLLQRVTVARGWADQQAFLAGYGAVQAMPGPVFSFAAYLGAVLNRAPNGLVGGLLALAAIYLPGLLLVVAVLPFWAALRRTEWLRNALAGVNASVVGILAAALYRPIWTSAIHTRVDVAIAAAAFALMVWARLPPWAAVLLAVGASIFP